MTSVRDVSFEQDFSFCSCLCYCENFVKLCRNSYICKRAFLNLLDITDCAFLCSGAEFLSCNLFTSSKVNAIVKERILSEEMWRTLWKLWHEVLEQTKLAKFNIILFAQNKWILSPVTHDEVSTNLDWLRRG